MVESARTPSFGKPILELLLSPGSSQRRALLAMRGTSMEPLLREGMVLEIAPFNPARARIGDIVIFTDRDRLVAHRIVDKPIDGFVRTCGDARPSEPETVPLIDIVGALAAVYANDTPGATRIDDEAFYRRGNAFARSRWRRAIALETKLALRRGDPRRREPAYEALVDIIAGRIANDRARILAAVDRIEPGFLLAFAQRHRCWDVVHRAVQEIDSERARELKLALGKYARAGAVQSFAYLAQVNAIVRILKGAGVPFALLKGAALAYVKNADAAFHMSRDIDIIVPASALEAAKATLGASGYTHRQSSEEQRRFLKRSHHIAPLYPPGIGWALEVHLQLERPTWVSTETTWEALEAAMIFVDGDAGPVRVLDGVTTAVHHAIHGIHLGRLRDVAICAKLLARFDDAEIAALTAKIAAERRDGIRLRAFAEVASRCAGLDLPAPDARVRAYLAWVALRERLPFTFAKRAHALEAWYACGASPLALRMRYLAAGRGTPLRVAGRLALVPALLIYLRCLR